MSLYMNRVNELNKTLSLKKNKKKSNVLKERKESYNLLLVYYLHNFFK